MSKSNIVWDNLLNLLIKKYEKDKGHTPVPGSPQWIEFIETILLQRKLKFSKDVERLLFRARKDEPSQ